MFERFRIPAVAVLALALPQLALAHAVLVASTPARNSVVHGSQMHIDLKFNSRVDGPRCTLSLKAPDGAISSLHLAAQSAPDAIASDASSLHPGAYTLRWQALAADGHITRGEIPFRVE